MSNSVNVSQLVDRLNQSNTDSMRSIVLTSGQIVRVKLLNVGQQSQIVKSVTSDAISNVVIQNTLNEIVSNNSGMDQQVLNILDRELILAAINSDTHTPLNISVQLDSTIEFGDIEVKAVIPSLSRDTKINEHFLRAASQPGFDLASTYLKYETLKYITSLSVGDMHISLLDLNDVNEYISIIDNIPAVINNKVVLFAETQKDIVKKMFKHQNTQVQTPLF